MKAFTLALLNSVAWEVQSPACDVLNADFNEDGHVDGEDVRGFGETLLNECDVRPRWAM